MRWRYEQHSVGIHNFAEVVVRSDSSGSRRRGLGGRRRRSFEQLLRFLGIRYFGPVSAENVTSKMLFSLELTPAKHAWMTLDVGVLLHLVSGEMVGFGKLSIANVADERWSGDVEAAAKRCIRRGG